MKPIPSFRLVASTRRSTWFGSSLILFGGALNVLALLALLSSVNAPGQPAPPGSDPVSASATATAAPSIPGAADPVGAHTHHHVQPPTATPQEGSRKLDSARNKLAPDTPSRIIGPSYSEEMLVAGTETESLETNVHAPEPTPTPVTTMPPASRIAIPAVGIDTGIVEVTSIKSEVNGRTVFNWAVADWAAGHHDTSANPGEKGNIVLTGHDDVRGEVFRGLHDIELGDQVFLTSDAGIFTYVVREIHVREYRRASLEEQVAAGAFLAPMPEERVTLVTCWPYGVDTHRIVVVAKPVGTD